MHSCSWWVCDDDIGSTVTHDEVLVQDIFHIAGVKQRVMYVVDLAVYLGVLNGFGYIFDTDYLTRLARYKVGNGARACVQVVNQFVSS